MELARHEFPTLSRQHAQELIQHGAAFQIRKTYESALVMGREALSRLGAHPEVVEDTMPTVRARDAERMALEQVGGMDASKALIHGNRGKPQHGH